MKLQEKKVDTNLISEICNVFCKYETTKVIEDSLLMNTANFRPIQYVRLEKIQFPVIVSHFKTLSECHVFIKFISV